jgi:hypothetical protein
LLNPPRRVPGNAKRFLLENISPRPLGGDFMRTLRLLSPLLAFAFPICAITINQTQTFDEIDSPWIIGVGPGGGTPALVPVELGGPGGENDSYLSIVSTGGDGPGSRLSAQNFNIWAGDYLTTGVTHIRMDVRNFGNTDLALRLLFVEFGPSGPVGFALTDAVAVPGGSDWQNIEFNIMPSALTAPLGTVESILANAGELRIFHNPDPFFAPGQLPAIAANVGVDNLVAAEIPEPSTFALLGVGLLVAGIIRRRRVA